VLNIVLGCFYGWYGTATATAVSSLLALGLAYSYVSQLITARVPCAEISRQANAAVLMGVVVIFGLRWALANSLLVVMVLMTLGAGLYFVTVFVLSPFFRGVVRRNLDREFDLIYEVTMDLINSTCAVTIS
jgi:O-antigen/teichoic acid export membrane protein